MIVWVFANHIASRMSAADLKTNQTFPYSILICIWLAVRGWLYSLRQAAFFKVLFHAISCILWQSGHQYLYPAVHLQHAFECYITQANIALKNGMLNNVKWCYRHKIFIFQLCCCCLYWFFFFNANNICIYYICKLLYPCKLWWFLCMVIS